MDPNLLEDLKNNQKASLQKMLNHITRSYNQEKLSLEFKDKRLERVFEDSIC
jgi:hypothetical protein